MPPLPLTLLPLLTTGWRTCFLPMLTEKCEESLRERTGSGGNRTVLWTNWILLDTTDGRNFLKCLDRQDMLKSPQWVPKGLTLHQARAQRLGLYMHGLVDRLNMMHHPQLLSGQLQIIEGGTVTGQDCKVIKCLADHVLRITAEIVPSVMGAA